MMHPDTRLGHYIECSVAGERVRAFVPPKLPIRPAIKIEGKLIELLEKANRALGRLDGVSELLPDTALFVYMYVRKEALLSSQIEGTQSSLSDLLLFENDAMPGLPLNDVQEVSNYVAALTYGLKRIKDENFPLSARLLREIHSVLLAKGRGAERDPGEFRSSQNWIGGSRPGNALFIPPPYERVPDLIANLEKFLHDYDEPTPVLVKAAIAHVQFETIHPFLDGNGRLGRLLITLLLCSEGVLQEPNLYLSLYFKRHRKTYYDLLQQVRMEGVWELWLEFFLEGVRETSQQAFATAKALLALFDEDRKRIEGLGRSAHTALRLHEYVQKKPAITIQDAIQAMSLTHPTVSGRIKDLEKLGILSEITGKGRNRVWLYTRYLNILNEGTEPL